MNNHWMRRTLLAVSIQLTIGGVYAAEVENVSEAITEEAVQNSEVNDQTVTESADGTLPQNKVAEVAVDTQTTSTSDK